MEVSQSDQQSDLSGESDGTSMSVKLLMTMLEEVGTVDQDGGVRIGGFRKLWEALFPHHDVIPDGDRVFAAIDVDGSDLLDGKEIFDYIRKAVEIRKPRQPKTKQEWIWVLFGFKDASYTGRDDRIRYLSYFVRFVSQLAIITSLVILMVESLPTQAAVHGDQPTVNALEITCMCVFILEYVAWCYSYPDGVNKFFKEPMTYIDLLALMPYMLSAAIQSDEPNAMISIRVLRVVIRSFRVLAMLKLGKASCATMLGCALKRSAPFLWWLCLVLLMVMTLTSSFMYHCERGEASFDEESDQWIRDINSSYSDKGQPLAFQSIPDTMWWSVVTLTSVGYGDKVPVTPTGKLVAAISMLLGVLVVGFPVTILTGSFQEIVVELDAQRELDILCLLFVDGLQKAYAKRYNTGGNARNTLRSASASPMPQGCRKYSVVNTYGYPYGGTPVERRSVILASDFSDDRFGDMERAETTGSTDLYSADRCSPSPPPILRSVRSPSRGRTASPLSPKSASPSPAPVPAAVTLAALDEIVARHTNQIVSMISSVNTACNRRISLIENRLSGIEVAILDVRAKCDPKGSRGKYTLQ
eukprot:TRINITY_DN11474_c0_g1_i1.p1 TRINITY_DN11474_c0_g1~~TRINITY_DN11474_c0_g1_i1.p1  ORF type:complete len:584 (+),score=89.38 TRINITY_DN11474_c0_g1_i1:120-1871(+)